MPYKILIFLSELKKYIDFNIKPLQIFGCDLWKMNNHFLFNKPKMMIIHKRLIDFFNKILVTHIGNTILLNHNLIRTMRSPIDNVILVEK